MMSSDPPFHHIAIVGLGLIGGSIALAIRERWAASRVTGVDSPAVLAHVLGSGAIDRAVESVRELDEADLVILAAPVRQNVDLLLQIPSAAPLVATDVG
ncbi:MAG: prephenate dehydrogenase/arogenate dehydrogenase family protein, partial [Vicinamibacterales bacterium]